MPNLLGRLILFVSSYSPLLFIFAALYSHKYPVASALSAVVGVLSIAITLIFLRATRRMLEPVRLTVDKTVSKDAEAMAYIVTYIVPFLALPFDTWRYWLSMGILFVMIAAIYMNSNLIFINPILNMAGFHVYEIESQGVGHFVITSKSHITKGSSFSAVRLGGGLFMEAPIDPC